MLETVADIMTSILESRWWLAQHVKANLPPPLLQPAPISFRQQVALEFDPATWRQSAEAMASEMSIVLDHMQRNPLLYSSTARNADAFRRFAVLVDDSALLLQGLLQEPASSSHF